MPGSLSKTKRDIALRRVVAFQNLSFLSDGYRVDLFSTRAPLHYQIFQRRTLSGGNAEPVIVRTRGLSESSVDCFKLWYNCSCV